MDKADVIKTVSEKTGIASATCEKVLKAFEAQASTALVGEFLGTNPRHAALLTSISQKTGIRPEECEKIVTALQAVVRGGISEKLSGFFKRLFSSS
jgi:hypothetical protein